MSLNNTFGAVYIGVVVAATLYGVTCVQTWYYYSRYPSDMWYIKLLVFAVWVSDTIHQILISHTVYTYLITDYGIVTDLSMIVWSLIVEVLFNAFTAFMVQCFLAMRIFKLSNKNWWMTMVVMALVFGELAIVIAYVDQALHMTTFAQLATLRPLSVSINAVAAASDALIALFLCGLLQRSRTGFKRSDTMINKLILFSINTGLLTSIDAVASLISITAAPNTFIYIAFYFSLGRFYCNSLLATLNARKSIRGLSRGDESVSLQEMKTGQPMSTKRSQHNNISIKIDTTHEYMRDESEPSVSDMKIPEV